MSASQAEGRGFKSRLALLLSAYLPRSRLRLHWCVCIVVALLSLTACKPDPLEEALRGELAPNENNLIIVGYCQSCHIHRALNPGEHLTSIRTLYDRVPYTVTTCRAPAIWCLKTPGT